MCDFRFNLAGMKPSQYTCYPSYSFIVTHSETKSHRTIGLLISLTSPASMEL